ncbi:hypothetical protein OESDEN_06567 [Oesophagostomum dentatum]|uniref:SSD domain-containing protein n=1 Tax=Oesophagostomum dentatum TaxID=61180 RepID=A0A0B1T7H4_OESDE|nr:hypothetical protein OESDEN_06567 [Oesophagostomum dentatum]
MTVYEPGGMFVDQMLNLRETTLQTSILTLFSMAVVCAIFIGKMCSVITATVSIASVTIGVVGIMSKLSFELDPVVMIALLMTIGLSVDYIAHVAYHFQNETRYKLKHGMSIRVVMKSMAEKVEHTVLSVAWPMMQAAISTICCVLPLVFVSASFAQIFSFYFLSIAFRPCQTTSLFSFGISSRNLKIFICYIKVKPKKIANALASRNSNVNTCNAASKCEKCIARG